MVDFNYGLFEASFRELLLGFYRSKTKCLSKNIFIKFDLRPFNLLKNCRNTEKIAKAAYDYVGETPNMFMHSPEGEDEK